MRVAVDNAGNIHLIADESGRPKIVGTIDSDEAERLVARLIIASRRAREGRGDDGGS